jgi:hypothetical protein
VSGGPDLRRPRWRWSTGSGRSRPSINGFGMVLPGGGPRPLRSMATGRTSATATRSRECSRWRVVTHTLDRDLHQAQRSHKWAAPGGPRKCRSPARPCSWCTYPWSTLRKSPWHCIRSTTLSPLVQRSALGSDRRRSIRLAPGSGLLVADYSCRSCPSGRVSRPLTSYPPANSVRTKSGNPPGPGRPRQYQPHLVWARGGTSEVCRVRSQGSWMRNLMESYLDAAESTGCSHHTVDPVRRGLHAARGRPLRSGRSRGRILRGPALRPPQSLLSFQKRNRKAGQP